MSRLSKRVSGMRGTRLLPERRAAVRGPGGDLPAGGARARRSAEATGWRESCVRRLVQRVYRKRGVSGQATLVREVLAADALPRR